jgi:2-keto-myo-inositol isomerase
MARYLNGATIMTTPTPRSLEVARETGYTGIEARAERLVSDPVETRATAEVVREGDVWSLNGVRISLLADGRLDRDQLQADLAARLEVCDAIGARALLAVPPRMAAITEAQALSGIREGLERASDAANRRGITVAFEFLGFADCPIRTPDASARAVEDLGGIALVLDSCHWHASGSGQLDAFPVERLAMVHLNDAPPKPPELVEDGDRVLPGLGVIQLGMLISDLRARGYAGPWSLETFNPGYWTDDPASVARRGASALDILLGTDQ